MIYGFVRIFLIDEVWVYDKIMKENMLNKKIQRFKKIFGFFELFF